MRDIAIAFAVSTLAALILGALVDAAAASTAFGAVFPTVIAVLERRERQKDRRREAELRQELESPPPAPPAQRREAEAPRPERAGQEASQASAQEEMRTLQQRATSPAIEWRRVAIGTIISVILVSLALGILSPVAALFAILFSEFALVVPMIIAATIMLGTGFWVARGTAGGGILSAAVMGSIVGVSVPLVLLLFFFEGSDQDQTETALALVIFTGAGVLLASIGGWLGVRRRQRAGDGV